MANASLIDIARGAADGYAPVEVIGRRSDLGNSEADVWTAGEASSPVATRTWPTAAAALSIVSGSADDAAAGTGARKVRVAGLDVDWKQIEEVVDLNGTTPVNTTSEFLRVNFADVEQAGSGGVNAGEILVKHGTDVQAAILAGLGRALQALYSVPADKRALLLRSWSEWDGNETAVRGYERRGASSLEPWRVFRDHRATRSTAPHEHRAIRVFPQKTDIRVRAVATAGTTYVAAGLELLLVDGA